MYHLFDGFVLSNDVLLQFLCHTLQSDAFLLCHSLYGNTGHHRHNVLHLLLGHRLTVVDIAFLPFAVQFCQLTFHHRLAVAISCCQFEVLVLHCQLLLLSHLFQFLFQLGYLGWYLHIIKMYARAHLVHSVNGLVGLLTVADIAV